MDHDWHAESTHTGLKFGPKLTVTGRLRGTVSGRPVELEARGRQLLLQMSSLRSVWRLRPSLKTSMLPLLRLLIASGISLRVSIGSRLTVNVLPKPNLALRVLVPTLNFASSGKTV